MAWGSPFISKVSATVNVTVVWGVQGRRNSWHDERFTL